MLPLQPSDDGPRSLGEDYFVVTLDVSEEHCDRLALCQMGHAVTVTGAASNEVDSVDGAPAHQANLPKAALKELLGSRAMRDTSPGKICRGQRVRAQVLYYFQAALALPLRRLRRVHLREFSRWVGI